MEQLSSTVSGTGKTPAKLFRIECQSRLICAFLSESDSYDGCRLRLKDWRRCLECKAAEYSCSTIAMRQFKDSEGFYLWKPFLQNPAQSASLRRFGPSFSWDLWETWLQLHFDVFVRLPPVPKLR